MAHMLNQLLFSTLKSLFSQQLIPIGTTFQFFSTYVKLQPKLKVHLDKGIMSFEPNLETSVQKMLTFTDGSLTGIKITRFEFINE